MIDGYSILRRITQVSQRLARGFEDIITTHEIIGAPHVIFSRFPGHVRIGFVNSAGLTGIDQTGMILGKTVTNFVRRDV